VVRSTWKYNLCWKILIASVFGGRGRDWIGFNGSKGVGYTIRPGPQLPRYSFLVHPLPAHKRIIRVFKADTIAI